MGDTVNLTIYRNGKKISVDVVLGEATGETTTQETDTDDQQQQQQPGYEQYYGGGLDGFNDFYGLPGF